MDLTARQIETLADTGASASLGGAAAYAAMAAIAPWLGESIAIAGSAAAAILAYGLSRRLLATVNPVRDCSTSNDEELLLVEEVSGERPSAQVVRLFDPASTSPAWAGPADTPGSGAVPDASEALHDALNRLRRSLR